MWKVLAKQQSLGRPEQQLFQVALLFHTSKILYYLVVDVRVCCQSGHQALFCDLCVGRLFVEANQTATKHQKVLDHTH